MEEYSLGELGQTEKEKTYDVSSRQNKKRDTKEQIYTTKATLRIQAQIECSRKT